LQICLAVKIFYSNTEIEKNLAISNNCQYKCLDLANGSSRCICPDGYSLSEDGRCLDLDECKNDIYPCISDQLCFNKLGTFSCINNLCPPKFHLDKTKFNSKNIRIKFALSQQCLPSCQNCTELPIRLYMLGLPKGVSVNTALVWEKLRYLDKIIFSFD